MLKPEWTPARALQAAALLGLVALAGCQGLQKMKAPSIFTRNGTAPKSSAEFQQPARMAVIWKETRMATRPGQKPTRGFGARVYLYNQDNDPVRAEGELVVYAFDDTQADPNNPSRIPDRKYVFRQADLQKHFSESDIGPSYSFWVPWDQAGGETTTVALLPIFKPVNGPIVQGGQSIAVLPGNQVDAEFNEIEFQTSSRGVRQISAAIDNGPDAALANAGHVQDERTDRFRDRTTTIHVPRSLGNQLQQLNAADPQLRLAQNRRENLESGSDKMAEAASSRADRPNLPESASASTSASAEPVDHEPVVFGRPGRVR